VEEKKLIALNVATLMKAIEVERPKVAALSALEVVNPKVPSTVDADALQTMSRNGEMGNFIVEGPIAYDIAISKEASAGKKHVSEVAGEPDILLMPNLEAANILTKAYKFHAQANSGGLVMGAKVPVVLNSRSDDAERRLNSLMMAMAIDSVSK
ncbi:MAG: phosphate acyltransferase, partial [Candidatus Delongbacteria bacterium]